MSKKTTPDDLLRFLYRETTHEEHEKIREDILQDPYLARTYHRLKIEKESLNGIAYLPSSSTINNILQFSREMNEAEKVMVY